MTDPNPYRPTVSPVSDRREPKKSSTRWRSSALATLAVLAFWIIFAIIVAKEAGMLQWVTFD